MTDKEKLEKLLKEFGIGYNLNTESLNYSENIINLEEGFGNVEGYSGFCVDFEFDEKGKFKTVGIYE